MPEAVATSGLSSGPSVSIVVPYGGGDLGETLHAIAGLNGRERVEVLLVDNSLRAITGDVPPDVKVVRAPDERSSYYARNVGGQAARGEWLLFIDADCVPDAGLLRAYFDPPPAPGCGVVAGSVRSEPEQKGLLARWARSRHHLSEEHHTRIRDGAPYAAGITGNLMVRRQAWESHGGFHEGIRSGGDVELCWRLQDSGWTFEVRPAAAVFHRHVTTLPALAKQAARHNAGRLWLRRRYPGAVPRPQVMRPLARCAAGSLVWGLGARFERAAFKLVDSVSITAAWWGWHLGTNAARRLRPGVLSGGGLTVFTDAFPARSETFVYNEVASLIERGRTVRVESSVRPHHVEREPARSLQTCYLEDDPPRRKLFDLLWLVARHPLGCARDLAARAKWNTAEDAWKLAAIAPAARRVERRGDTHLHAHFAAGAALNAMRISRILGLSYSVTAHAYDIFQKPRNLSEKLNGASFVVGECDYTVEHMRLLVRDGLRERVHRVATGVDATAFRRRLAPPARGRVGALGRHVEKKGFPHLITAAGLLRGHPGFERIVIAGEGPLRARHAALIDELEVADLVALRGNVWGARGVAAFLEQLDLLVIPAVVAADGDRDALPVVSYEALAMEVPVVASDLVGLPEVVRPPWGTLVAPGDPAALADAIADVLSRTVDDRRELGRMGRDFVIEYGDPERSVGRLDALFDEAGAWGRSR